MDMHGVKSSSVKKIGWEDEIFAAEYMGGGTYHYWPVPKSVYSTIEASTSKGASIDALIKKQVGIKYKCKKVS
jgi:hypothetical protein